MLPQKRAARTEYQRRKLETVPRVLEASQRMQVLIGLDCQEPWPAPPTSMPEQTTSTHINSETLGNALANCADLFAGVPMNSLSVEGELVDRGVANLKEDTDAVQQLHTACTTAIPVGVVETSLKPSNKEENPRCPQKFRPAVGERDCWIMPGSEERPRPNKTEKPLTHPQFPNLRTTPRSFTSAICQGTRFAVKPCLSMTLPHRQRANPSRTKSQAVDLFPPF